MSVEKLQQARLEAEELKQRIKAKKEEANDTTLRTYSSSLLPSVTVATNKVMKVRRVLKGHVGKIYSMDWAADKPHLASASQDSKVIVWNALTTHKIHALPLRSPWVMTCAFSPVGDFIATGGLDSLCTIWNVRNREAHPCRELAEHSGYVSCARFISEREVLSSSGDSSCILWDIETGTKTHQFTEHKADVMSIAVHPTDKNLFISGSTDATAKLHDIRQQTAVQTFEGHESDLNAVQFFPNGNAFGTASDDASCRLFDIRSDRELIQYSHDTILSGVTSLAFSVSGRLLFAGYEDCSFIAWDTLKGEKVYSLTGHEMRVSCIGVSYDGMALCTGSWDTRLKIWA